MFNITDEAQIYVADLFAQQDEEGLGLKVDIEKASAAMVYLIFSSSGASSLGASPLALGAVIVSFLLEPFT
jgi:Fe/S biogenesis protein NfuA